MSRKGGGRRAWRDRGSIHRSIARNPIVEAGRDIGACEGVGISRPPCGRETAGFSGGKRNNANAISVGDRTGSVATVGEKRATGFEKPPQADRIRRGRGPFVPAAPGFAVLRE